MTDLSLHVLDFASVLSLLQTPLIQVELGLVALCFVLALGVARVVFHKFFGTHPERFEQMLPYLLFRLVFPLVAGALMLLTGTLEHLFIDAPSGLLFVASVTMFWLAVIRVVAALVRHGLPRGRLEQHSEHLMSSALWLFYLSHLLGFNDFIVKPLEAISFSVGKTELNLLMILSGLFWIVLIIFITLWLGRFLDQKLMSLQSVDMSLRIVLSKLLRTLLIVLGVLIALPVIGIDLTVLSVFGGALGVGLGFGLQKIASNYMSGFIILLDRSVKVGDRVQVGEFHGIIEQITARYVVVRNVDGSDALIPNELFVTGAVVNQSFKSRELAQNLTVGVAYGTDLRMALSLLKEVSAKVDRVMSSPEPNAFVVSFDDSSIMLKLIYWVADPENGLAGVRSDINLAIWDAFQAHNIEIPFPQRDINVKTLESLSDVVK